MQANKKIEKRRRGAAPQKKGERGTNWDQQRMQGPRRAVKKKKDNKGIRGGGADQLKAAEMYLLRRLGECLKRATLHKKGEVADATENKRVLPKPEGTGPVI